MQQQEFNPANVPIQYTLNFAQVNLILRGLAELPRKESDGFYEQFRQVALQTLQAAEFQHNNPPAPAEAYADVDAPADKEG